MSGAGAASNGTGSGVGADLATPPPAAQPSAPEPARKSGGWSSLLSRVATALVVGAVGGYGVFRGGWLYATFVALISWMCTLEYIGLVTSKRLPKGLKAPPLLLRRTMVGLCVGMIAAAHFGIRTGVFETAAFVLLCMLLITRAGKRKPKKRKVRFSELTTLVFGLFYCGYLPTFWVRLRGVSVVATGAASAASAAGAGTAPTVGLLATLVAVLSVVAADTGAYFGGKFFGRNPLISISPNKTVEGAVAGFLSSLAITLAFNRVVGWPGNALICTLLAVVTFVASVFGDLIESSMKRAAGKKDSGSILPGHGGCLDRFDSYIFTSVLNYCVVYWYYWAMGTPISSLIIIPPR